MSVPILLDENEKFMAILDKAYDVIVESEIITTSDDGYETLSFKVPFRSKNRQKLYNEGLVEVNDRVYVIKVIDDDKSGQNITSVECDARWYDLSDGELLNHTSTSLFTPTQALNEQLSGTGWTVGTVEITESLSFNIPDNGTRLYNIRLINRVYGGELWFDTKNKTVSLYNKIGRKTDLAFAYSRNMPKVKRSSDTRNIITRYKLTGVAGLSVGPINGGLDYVEDYSYYDNLGLTRKLKSYEESNEDFTSQEKMLNYMHAWISIYSQPLVSYDLSVTLLKDIPNLGDYIYVMDEELGLKKWLRVVSSKINAVEPWNSSVTLETLQGDITKTLNAAAQVADVAADVLNNVKTTFEKLSNAIVLKVDDNGNVALFELLSDEGGTVITIKADNISLEGLVTANEGFRILLDGSFEAVAGLIAGFTVTPENSETHDGGFKFEGDGKFIRISPYSSMDGNGGFNEEYGAIDLGLADDGENTIIHLRSDGYARFGLVSQSGASIRLNDFLRYDKGVDGSTNTIFYSKNFKIYRDGTADYIPDGSKAIVAMSISDTEMTLTTGEGYSVYEFTRDTNGRISSITNGSNVIEVTWG